MGKEDIFVCSTECFDILASCVDLLRGRPVFRVSDYYIVALFASIENCIPSYKRPFRLLSSSCNYGLRHSILPSFSKVLFKSIEKTSIFERCSWILRSFMEAPSGINTLWVTIIKASLLLLLFFIESPRSNKGLNVLTARELFVLIWSLVCL